MQASIFFHFLWTINSVFLDIMITIIIIDGIIHNFKLLYWDDKSSRNSEYLKFLAANWKKKDLPYNTIKN